MAKSGRKNLTTLHYVCLIKGKIIKAHLLAQVRGDICSKGSCTALYSIRKNHYSQKICCTTYKNIYTCEKKAVPLQRERVYEIFTILYYCMDSRNNSHIINLLHSGKFTDVNFTQSKLAKSLHLKIGAKVIKKTNTNKLNYKIMIKLPKKIARTIEREFSSDVTIIKRVYIHSMHKKLCVNLIEFRPGTSPYTIILRYFGDDSYSFLRNYTSPYEVAVEMAYQVRKLY